MNEQDLKTRLLSDLTCLGLPMSEVVLELRPYSVSFFGRYLPIGYKKSMSKPSVVLYPYDKQGGFMPYESLLDTVIHEMTHHMQYTSGEFKRKKGIMHDPQFWLMYNRYKKRAVRCGLLKGGKSLCADAG